MTAPHEILPGVLHWTSYHEGIHHDVSSYYLVDERVLLDPRRPDGGFDALALTYGEPEVVVLSNRHHYRHAGEAATRFGAEVLCHEAGLHEFADGRRVQPYAFGDTLPGGLVAEELDAICPDET